MMLAVLLRALIALALAFGPLGMAHAMPGDGAAMAGKVQSDDAPCPQVPDKAHPAGKTLCAFVCMAALSPTPPVGVETVPLVPLVNGGVPAIGAPLICEVATPPPQPDRVTADPSS